ncbi:restriction endonuclease subunit S [Streptococcus suis]|nr:restriction endonuclease subunit S [Streptococcus suis]
MSEVVSLESLCSGIIDCPHSTPNWKVSGIPVIRNYNLVSGRIDKTNLSYVTEEEFLLRTKRAVPEYEDIIISREAPMGVVGIVPEKFKCCLGQRLVLLKVDKEKCYPKFLLYALMSNFVQKQIERVNLTGSIVSNLNISSLKDLQINLVTYSQQVDIANCLDLLDQKIALNNQINEELEAMAKTLYDYWFVQFDFPDENGKPYKSSGGKMVYNDQLKREIPEGWGVKPLGELADLYQPQTLSEKDLISNGRYFVYGANGIIGKYNKYNHETPMLAIACRGNSCGVINITQPFSWITGNAMVVKPKFEYICIDYLKYSLLNGNIYKTISGSAQPQITRTNLSPLLLLQADETILSEYADRINSMFSLRIKNFQQNQELTQLRDWLLPMLMNGQVKVE